MNDLRQSARELRKKGLTYAEIGLVIGKSIPKSTMSYWCRDIVLTEVQQARITTAIRDHLANARTIASRSRLDLQHKRSEEGGTQALELVGDLRLREAKIVLAALYLGEGYKYPSYRGMRLGSSDPDIIKLYIRLLRICFGIEPANMKCIISHRADQKLTDLINYWSGVTGISPLHFYRSKPDPRTTHKPTKNQNYKGVATISCRGVAQQLELAHVARALLIATSPQNEGH